MLNDFNQRGIDFVLHVSDAILLPGNANGKSTVSVGKSTVSVGIPAATVGSILDI